MPQKTLDLTEPKSIFGRQITRLTFNEPTGGMYIDYGEPGFMARSADGMSYFVDNDQAIKAYMNACLAKDGGVENDGPAVLAMLSLRDAVAAKRLVLSFFTAVVEALSKPS
jgi:hypothetical protein